MHAHVCLCPDLLSCPLSHMVLSDTQLVVQMLEDCAQITPATTWLEACGMLESDPRFSAVDNVRDREEIFAEHKHKLTQQARNLERQQRSEAMARLRDKMKTQDWLSVDATWRQAKAELADDACFKGLEKMDALRVFEDLMHEMHRAEDQSQARKRILRRRAERKARNDFRSLLSEAKKAATITASSSWASCKPILQKDSRYLANDGRAGSTAWELFDDLREVRLVCTSLTSHSTCSTPACSCSLALLCLVQELEEVQEAMLSRAKAALREAGVDIGKDTEVEAVAAVLTPEAGWEIDDVVTVHAGLVAASIREAKEAARAQAKKEERFLALLKDYAKDKEITVEDKWGESMIALLEGHSAYKAMDSDDHRSRTFDEFMVKLEKKKSSKKKSSKKSKKRKGSSRKEKRKREDSDEEEGEVSSDSGDEEGEAGGKRRKRGDTSPDMGQPTGTGLADDAAALEARRKEILAQLKDADGGLVGATTTD